MNPNVGQSNAAIACQTQSWLSSPPFHHTDSQTSLPTKNRVSPFPYFCSIPSSLKSVPARCCCVGSINHQQFITAWVWLPKLILLLENLIGLLTLYLSFSLIMFNRLFRRGQQGPRRNSDDVNNKTVCQSVSPPRDSHLLCISFIYQPCFLIHPFGSGADSILDSTR